MSVVKSRRKQSKLEVIYQAAKLRVMLSELSFRNFGIKDPENAIRPRYDIYRREEGTPIEEYDWLLAGCSRHIDTLCAVISHLTRAANRIYATNIFEYFLRRILQDIAIVSCEMIIDELQYLCTIFNVDINYYERYVDAVDYEIALLKGWRKSDNKIKKQFPLNGVPAALR